MQTTLIATLCEKQENINLIKSQLYTVIELHSKIQRKLYKEIISYFTLNNVNQLPKNIVNEFKSSYQLKFNINARQFNSIYSELTGKIFSILELNKAYLADTKDNIESLNKAVKSKQKTLNNLNVKLLKHNYVFNNFDLINKHKLIGKLYHLNHKLMNANKKLVKLTDIEKTGNPHLCFGSKKLFSQQFQISKENNQTEFKSLSAWKKSWVESRNKSFFLVGSSDESLGNQNCQIKYIENNNYELKVNINPKEAKLSDRYINFQIQLHNDKNNLVLNAINNNIGQDKSLYQALTYRFYKDKDNYRVFISLDKSKQQPKTISYKLLGTIGIDINANHLSLSEINHDGNLLKSFDLHLDLIGTTSQQAIDNIGCAVKKLTDYAVTVGKPIILENLNFSQKKSELKSGINKNYNVMLSSFAYSKIIELIKSRCFDKGIEVIDVNPAYTSKIGKFKYQNQYKLSTHQAAALVIARRGLLSYEKLVKINIKDKQTGLPKVIDKLVTLVNKEKTISVRNSKYYAFDLPVRNNQKSHNIYWKEIEHNCYKAKKHRIDLKRKKLILNEQDLLREITVVANNCEVNRDLNPNTIPF